MNDARARELFTRAFSKDTYPPVWEHGGGPYGVWIRLMQFRDGTNAELRREFGYYEDLQHDPPAYERLEAEVLNDVEFGDRVHAYQAGEADLACRGPLQAVAS